MEPILVIEEYAPLQELYQKELEREGYRIIAVKHPAEAIRLIEDQSFAAVIVEITSLCKAEFEALRRALNQNRELPVIINTGGPGRCFDQATQPFDTWVSQSSDADPIKKVIEFLKSHPPAVGYLCSACQFFEPVNDLVGKCSRTGNATWPKFVPCEKFVVKTNKTGPARPGK